MHNTEKPTKPDSHYTKKKKKEGGLKCGKHEGRSGGIAGFQTSLNTSYLSSRLPRARVGGG